MDIVAQLLELSLGLSFVGLAFVCLLIARRHDDRTLPWAGWAFLAIGVLLLLNFLGEPTDFRYEALAPVQLLAFLLSGYLLLYFRHSLMPLPLGIRRAALAAVIVLTPLILLVDLPYTEHPHLAAGEFVLVMTVALVWSAFVAGTAIGFWRESGARPSVQRARLRALSTGFAGLVIVALAWTGSSNVTGSEVLVGVQSFALTMVPLLYVSFAPPLWLRRAWREKEETSLFAAQELSLFHPEVKTLADHAVQWARRLVGADGGFLVSAEGEVLAVHGVDTADIDRLRVESSRPVITIPLSYGQGTGALVLVTGPFTPVFGSDEVERLEAYGSIVAVALDRVRLVMALGHENERYERLLQAVSDLDEGVVVTDQGGLVYANDAYMRMTGYTLEELKALPSLLELSVPEEREMLTARFRSRLAGGQVEDHYEAGLVHKAGHRVDIEAAVKLTQTNEGPRIVSVVRDVTERKRHERKLKELDAIKSDFISNAAHELRTPLTSLLGLAATLANSRHRLTEKDVDACIDGLDRGAKRLATLVNRLLDFTQIESGRLQVDLQGVPLAEVANRVVEANPAPEGVEVRIEISENVVVWADPLRLDQILTNLVSNAYRYGGRDIKIHAEPDRETVLVDVDDDGPGVPETLLDHLFDPFVRGSDEQHGAGLGLAIVQRLAEAFGGRISYHPVRPHGARFRLRLRKIA
ncbi:MAG: ATP-binding protein [Actinomycetota bacterium]